MEGGVLLAASESGSDTSERRSPAVEKGRVEKWSVFPIRPSRAPPHPEGSHTPWRPACDACRNRLSRQQAP